MTRVDKSTHVLIWAVILISIITFQFWEYFKYTHCILITFPLFAFLTVIMSVIILINSKVKYIYSSVFLLSISLNNLADELFFDPVNFGVSEKIIAIAALIVCGSIYTRNG